MAHLPSTPRVVITSCAYVILLTSFVQAAIIPSEPDSLQAVHSGLERRGPSDVGPVYTRKLLQSLSFQQRVEDAVRKEFDYLIGLNTGARNPLQAVDIPCQEFQQKGDLKNGPYYLTAIFYGNNLPIPLRSCKFKSGIPVVVTVGDVICAPLCSAQTGTCDCCDGTVNTAVPSDPSNTATCPVTGRTDCSYCADATNLGFFDGFKDFTGSSATLTDLSIGMTTALELASVSVGPDQPITLTPNSFYRARETGLSYGPDTVMIGPPLYVGQFALIDPALLLPGHSYRVETVSPGYNNGNPVVYEIDIHGNKN